MQHFIGRLIRCGIPRVTAVSICNWYRCRGRMDDLRAYVEAVEDETNITLGGYAIP